MLTLFIIKGMSDISNLFTASVRSKETSAAHTGVHIPFKLQHLLFRNIIRNHSLGSAFCCKLCQIPVFTIFTDIIFLQAVNQFRESRSDIITTTILNTKHSLFKHYFNQKRQVFFFPLILCLIQIHEYSHKRRLSICCL